MSMSTFDRVLRTAFAAALSLTLSVTQVLAQAALLPNAKQTFLDSNGNPLSLGKVYSYVPSTTNFKTTWTNSAQSAANTNPITLDSAGRAVIYGQGSYQQKVTDSLGNVIWNAPTTAYGSTAPSGSTGTDTAPVGSVMAFTGFTIPTNWQLAYGQAISRTTFSDLKTALTIVNASTGCTSSSTTLTGFADTTLIKIGAPIEASCIPTSTTVARIVSATSLTVSNAATATGTVSATVYPWGAGDGTTTFNVPDMRGVVLAGYDTQGGTAANVTQVATTISTTNSSTSATVASATRLAAGMTIVSTNVPAGATISTIIGTAVTLSAAATATAAGVAATFQAFPSSGSPAASGGSINHVQTAAEMRQHLHTVTSVVTDPTHAHNITDPTHGHNITDPGHTHAGNLLSNSAQASGGVGAAKAGGSDYSTGSSGTGITVLDHATGITINSAATGITVASTAANTGSSAASTIVQPTLTVGYIIKVAPNSTGAGGVVSIGGMFGDIACDASFVCAPVGLVNTIGCAIAIVGQIGCIQPDNITLTVNPATGVASAIAGVASQINVGVTTISGGVSGRLLYNNASILGEMTTTGSGTVVALQTDPVILGHPTIEGVTATGATGTGTLVFGNSPTLTTPVLGAATATTLRLGGAAIGSNALAVTGTALFNSAVTLVSTLSLGGALTYGGVTLSNSVTGTGNMVLATSPTLTGTPVLGTATGTSLSLGGATLGSNALAVTGTTDFNSAVTMDAALTYGGVTLANAVTGTGNMVLATVPTLSFGTGADSLIPVTSINTGFSNHLRVRNSGTIATSGTNAGVMSTLTAAANTYVLMDVTGGASPSGRLLGGSDLTGGLTISTGAGNLVLASPTLFTGAAASTGSNGQATIGASATAGVVVGGKGSSKDLTLANASGTSVCDVATGGTTINCATLTLTNQLAGSQVASVANAAGAPSATFGVMKCDGVTVTCASGVVTAVGAVAASIDAGGATTVSNGTNGTVLTQQSGAVSKSTPNGGLTLSTTTLQIDGNYSGWALQNCSLAASVASNLLTVSLKDSQGGDPSSTSPCNIVYRSDTAATGSNTLVQQTAALSISTNATGATLGSSNSTAFRFWVVVFNNSSTNVLALINCSTSAGIFAMDEDLVVTTVPISGSATSPGVFYTPNGTTVTSKAFRILGYIEYDSAGLTTAGTYASAPDFIQTYGPGVRLPGQIIQQKYATTASSTTTSSASFVTTNLSQAISPKSAANLIEINVSAIGQQSTAAVGIQSQIGRSTTPVGNFAWAQSTADSFISPISLYAIDKPNTTSSTTYNAMARSGTGGTNVVFLPSGATGSMSVKEIQG